MRKRSLVAAALSLLLACGGLGCSASAADPPPATTSTPAAALPAGASATSSAGAPASASLTATSAAASPTSSAAARVTVPAGTADARALADKPPRPASGKGAGLVGPVDAALDAEWITRLATAEIVELSPNKGGGSVSLKAKLSDGKKAAIKLQQSGHPTDPRAEIAAYHLDRLLGFGRTAVVVGRSFAVADLRAALVSGGADAAFLERFDRVLIAPEGRIAAALVAWHTAPLTPEEAAPAWASALESKEAVTGDALSRLAEWSDLTVFDFLVDNPDRLSGGNVLRLDKGGPLVFLDQGAAFGKNRLAQKLTLKDRLDKVCRFRKDTLSALTGKGESLGEQLRKSLSADPLAPVLDAAQLAGVDDRAKLLAAHVRACKSRLGAAALL